MKPWWHALIAASILTSISAYGNGWAFGQNFVPVVEETIATDENGNRLTLAPGTPVYLMPGDGNLEAWLLWDERPWERRIEIARDALPERLDAFRAYQRDEFQRSAELFEAEAKTETDPTVRSWKTILAGHSHLLVDMANTDKAIALYRLAAQDATSIFQVNAQYFVFRVILSQKKYAEARAEFAVLRGLPKNGAIAGNLLFVTYPQYTPLTAWSLRDNTDKPEAKTAFDDFIDAKNAFDTREALNTDARRAEVCYRLAMAMEKQWRIFPEQVFDRTDHPDVPAMLELTFETYPATDAAAKAYYEYLYYQQYWDFDGERVEWEQQQKELMERFLAKYPDASPAPQAQKRLEHAVKYIEEHTR